MAEVRENTPTSLNTGQEMHIAASINALVVSDFITGPYSERMPDVRQEARDYLAHAIIDTSINGAVTDFLVEEHSQTDELGSTARLYAYWDIIQSAHATQPDSVVPNTFVSFVQALAARHGESDTAFELNLHYTQEAEAAAAVEETPVALLNEFAESTRLALAELREHNITILEDLLITSRMLLQNQTGSQQASEALRLLLRVGLYNQLSIDIGAQRFSTPQGRAVANAQYDRDQLTGELGQPLRLLNDINAKRFLTPEGLAAAQTQQDDERLTAHSVSPADLQTDIKDGLFTTQTGLLAAQAQLDRLQLTHHRGNLIGLWQAIVDRQFLTDVGLNAACLQQDSDRLDQHGHNVVILQSDIQHNRFLTPAGKAEALRLLGWAE